jgi:hypothetical protein
MSRSHGKNTYISLNGVDLSAYCDSSEHHKKPDVHDVTTYGNDSHVKDGGLLDGTGSIGGLYDTTTGTGPRAVINPLVGSVVTYIRRPEGTGSGKPQDSVSVLVGEYVETSPVADYVRWTLALEYSGDITSSTQS